MKNELIVIMIDDNEEELNQTVLQLKTVVPMDQYDLNVYQFAGFRDELLRIHADVCIIDLNMKEMNGFQVARIISSVYPDTKIVFCTKHNNLVFETFKYDVFCFVRKDHLLEDLKKMIKKIGNESQKMYPIDQMQYPLRSIVYFEASHNYLLLHMHDGTILKDKKRLKEIDENTLDGFGKISSGFIVNFRYIKKMEKEKITLLDGTNLYISRANKHRIKEKYSLYILGDCYG